MRSSSTSRLHAVGLGVDAAQGAGAFGRVTEHPLVVELEVTADRGERRAQFVGGVGDEPPQLRGAALAGLESRFDLMEHGVEGEPQLFDLQSGVAVRRHASREVSVGDGRRGLDHVFERPHPVADADHREDGEQSQQTRAEGDVEPERLVDAGLDVGRRRGEEHGRAVGEAGAHRAVRVAVHGDVARLVCGRERLRVVDRGGEVALAGGGTQGAYGDRLMRPGRRPRTRFRCAAVNSPPSRPSRGRGRVCRGRCPVR